MDLEISCGAIVYNIVDNQILYVIIESTEGHYGFPKGHIENNETYEETALREIKEEVGIDVKLDTRFSTSEEYPLPTKPGVTKKNIYFVARYNGEKLSYQKEELNSVSLMTYEKARSIFQFDSLKRIIDEANDYLTRTIKKEA